MSTNSSSQSPAGIDNPFFGLRSFKPGERLFGRDRDFVLMKDRILSGRTTLFFSGSGVGKTSFLNAKLKPELSGNHAICLHYTWTEKDLVKAVRESIKEQVGSDDAPSTAGSALAIPLKGTKKRRGLLVLDQFEELFQYHHDTRELVRLVGEIANLVNEGEGETRIVLSMREEFLGELSVFDNLIPNLFNNYYRLKNPTQSEAEEIVRSTAERCGVESADDGLKHLMEDLLSVRAEREASFSERTSRESVALPYLQIACSGIWQKTKPDQRHPFLISYKGGDAEAELGEYCENKLQDFSDEQKELLADALGYLISGGAKYARKLGELAGQIGIRNTDALQELLSKLSGDVKILRTFNDPFGEPWFQLYHDMYIPFLSDWKATLDRKRKQQREELEALAKKQQEDIERAEKLEKKRLKIAKFSRWALTAAFLITVLTFVGYNFLHSLRTLESAPVTYVPYAKVAQARDYLRHIPYFSGKAARLWTAYWDRQVQSQALQGNRDAALLYSLRELEVASDDVEHRRIAQVLSGDVYEQLEQTYHAAQPIDWAMLTSDGSNVIAVISGNQVQRWDAASGRAVGSSLEVTADWVVPGSRNPVGEAGASALKAQGNQASQEQGLQPQPALPQSTQSSSAIVLSRVLQISPDGSKAIVAFTQATPITTKPQGATFVKYYQVKLTGQYSPGVKLCEDSSPRAVVPQFAPTAPLVAVSCQEGLQEFDSNTGKSVAGPLKTVTPAALTFSPSGNILAAITSSGDVSLWNAKSGAALPGQSLKRARDRSPGMTYYKMLFTNDEKFIITITGLANAGMSIFDVWELSTGKPVKQWYGFGAAIRPDNTMASVKSDGGVSFWNFSTNKPLAPGFVLPTESQQIGAASRSAAFGPDGKYVLTWSSSNNVIHRWRAEPRTGPCLRLSPGALSWDTKLAAGSDGDKITVLDTATGATRYEWSPPKPKGGGLPVLWELAFSPDGAGLMEQTNLGLRFWKLSTAATAPVPVPVTGAQRWAFLAGNQILTTNSAGQCSVWRTSDAGFEPEPSFTNIPCTTFATDRNGTTIATFDGSLGVSIWQKNGVWNQAGGMSPSQMSNLRIFNPILTLAPDGRHLITASNTKLALWSTFPAGYPFEKDFPSGIRNVVFGPGRDSILVATSDSRLFQVGTGKDGNRETLTDYRELPVRQYASMIGSPDGGVVLSIAAGWMDLYSSVEHEAAPAWSLPLAGSVLSAYQFGPGGTDSVTTAMSVGGQAIVKTYHFDLSDVPPLNEQNWTDLRKAWEKKLDLELDPNNNPIVPVSQSAPVPSR